MGQIPTVGFVGECGHDRDAAGADRVHGGGRLGQFGIGEAVDRTRGQFGDVRRHLPPRLVHDPNNGTDVRQSRKPRAGAETVVAQTIHDQDNDRTGRGRRRSHYIDSARPRGHLELTLMPETSMSGDG